MKYIVHRKNKKIDELLRACINCEMNKAKDILLEKHGYYINISKIVEPIVSKIIKSKDDIVKNGHTVFVFNDMSIFNGVDLFFDGFSVKVDVTFDRKMKYVDSDGAYYENSKMNMVDGKINFCPNIEIYVEGGSIRMIAEDVATNLSHEFTHAYTDYMIFRNSGGKKRLRYGAGLRNAISDDDSKSLGYDKDVVKIFYVLNKYEQNAFFSQLKQEIEDYPRVVKTSTDLTKAIMSTYSYFSLHEILGLIQKINEMELKQSDKNSIVNEINRCSGKKFKDFDAAMNYINKIARKAKRKFDSISSKIAFDVFCSNKNNR